MNKENTIGNNKEGDLFIKSIRQKAEKEALEIKKGTENEIARLKELAAEEVREFSKKSEEETHRHLEAELGKVNNRYEIDKRKVRLSLIEEITGELTQRAFERLHSGDKAQYKEMLRSRISDIREHVHDSAEILCGSEDADLIREIQQSIPGGEKKEALPVKVDPDITGGFIVNDPESGQSINCTFQRILYRSMDNVRREVFKTLSDLITLD